jgi:hypothetical protein
VPTCIPSSLFTNLLKNAGAFAGREFVINPAADGIL